MPLVGTSVGRCRSPLLFRSQYWTTRSEGGYNLNRWRSPAEYLMTIVHLPSLGSNGSPLNGPLQVLVCHEPWPGIISALKISRLFCKWRSLWHTKCEARKAQTPELSTIRIYTWPVSRKRMPTHISASHILLYSETFFIKVVLRWHFLRLFDFLPLFKAIELTPAIASCFLALWKQSRFERMCSKGFRNERLS